MNVGSPPASFPGRHSPALRKSPALLYPIVLEKTANRKAGLPRLRGSCPAGPAIRRAPTAQLPQLAHHRGPRAPARCRARETLSGAATVACPPSSRSAGLTMRLHPPRGRQTRRRRAPRAPTRIQQITLQPDALFHRAVVERTGKRRYEIQPSGGASLEKTPQWYLDDDIHLRRTGGRSDAMRTLYSTTHYTAIVTL